MHDWNEANCELAGEIRGLLERTGVQLVCAESCTAGLVAATLGKWPGISGWLCGSLVVYQTDIKHQWLGIDESLLNDPSIGPVSKEVTRQLTRKALEKTPPATWSVAVTGHLGPGAPTELDGVVFIALAQRKSKAGAAASGEWELIAEEKFELKQLEQPLVRGATDGVQDTTLGRKLRETRMLRAVWHVLNLLRDSLQKVNC